MADIRLNLIADLGSFKSALAAAAAEARGTVAQVSIGVDIKAWQKELSEAKRRLRTSLNPNQEIKFKLGPMTALYNSLDSLQKRIENVVKAGDKPVTFDITLDVKNSSVNAAKKLVKDAFSGEYLVPFRVAVADASLTAAKKAVQDSFGAEGFSAAFNVKAISRSINAAKTEVRDAFGADNYKVKFFVAPTTGSLNAAKAAVKEAFSPDNFSVPFGIKLIAGSVKPTQDTIEEALEAFTASFNVAPTTRSINAAKAALKDAFTGESAGDFRPDFNLGNATTASIAEAKAFIATKFEGFKVDFDVEATSGSIRKALAAVKQGFAQVVTKKQDPEAEGGFREIAKDVLVPFKLDPDVAGAQKALLAGFKALRVPFVLDEPGNVAAIAADIAKAIQAAIAAAGVIRPSADLSELIALNEELSRKQAHLAQVAADFTGTPIKPLVDTSELDRLSAALEEITAKAARAIAAAQGVVQAQGPGPTAMKLQELVSAKTGTSKSPLRKAGFQYLAKELGVEDGSIAQMQPQLTEKAAGIGEDTARGILMGLVAMQGEVGKKAALLGEVALKDIKDFLEIRSPSRKARREVGVPWVDGIIAGVLDRVPALKQAVDKLGSQLDVRDKVKRLQAQLKPDGANTAGMLEFYTEAVNADPTDTFSAEQLDRRQKRVNQIQRRIAELQSSDVIPKEFIDGRWQKQTGLTSTGAASQPAIEQTIAKPAAEATQKVAALNRELETVQATIRGLERLAQSGFFNAPLEAQLNQARGRAQELQSGIASAKQRADRDQRIASLPPTAIDPNAYDVRPNELVKWQVAPGDFSRTLARTPTGRQRQLGENRRLTAENAFATLGLGGTDFDKAADTTAQQKALATLGALQKAGTISAGDYARAQLKVKQASLDAALPLGGLTESIKDLGRQIGTATQDVLLYGAAFQALSVVQQLPGRIYEAVKAQDAFSNTLKASLGVGDTYGQQVAFLTRLSEQYGLNLAESRQGLTKLFAALRQSGAATEDINKLQESVAVLGASFNLNPEQLDRVSTALAQIGSKGQLTAEELKGQLGDVLPGAVAQFAEAAGFKGPDAIAKFNKSLEAGEFQGEKLKAVLKSWSEIVRRDFSGAAAQAGNSLQGLENRFNNLTTRIFESFNGPLSEIAPKILAPLVGNLEKTADALDVVFGTSSNREAKLKAQLAILKQAGETGSAPRVGDTVGGKAVTASNLLELGLKEGQAVDVEAIKTQTQQLNDQLGQTQSRLQDLKDDGSVQSLANDFRNAANTVKAFFEGVGTALAPLNGLLTVVSAILRPLGALGSSTGALAGFLVAAIVQVRLGTGALGALQAAFTGLTTVSATSASALATTRGQLSLVGAQAAGATVQVGALRAAWINLGSALKLTPWLLLFAAIGGVIGQITKFQEQQENTRKRQKSFEQAITLAPAQNGRYVTNLDRYGEVISKAIDVQKQIRSATESGDSDRVSVLEKQRDEILKQAAGYTVAKDKLNQLSQAERQRLVDSASERVQRLRAQESALAAEEQDQRKSLNDAKDVIAERRGVPGFLRSLNPFQAIPDALDGAVNGDKLINALNQARDAGKSLADIGQKRKVIQEQINKAVKEEADILEKTRRQQVDQSGQDAKRRLAQFFTGALGLSQDNIDKVVQELQARLKTSTPGTKDFSQQLRAIELAKALAEDAGKSVLQKFAEASKVQADAARQIRQAEIDAADVRRQAVREALNDRLTGVSEEGKRLLEQVEDRKSREIQVQNDIKKIQLEISDVQRRSWENQVKQAVLIQSIIESTQLPGLKPARDNELLASVLATYKAVDPNEYKSITGKDATSDLNNGEGFAARRAFYAEAIQRPGYAGREPLKLLELILGQTDAARGYIPAASTLYRKNYKDKYGSDYRTPAEARADAQRRGSGLNQTVNAKLSSLEGVDVFRQSKLDQVSLGAEARSLEIAQGAKQGLLDRIRNLRSPQSLRFIELYQGLNRQVLEQQTEGEKQRAINQATNPQGRRDATVELQYYQSYGREIERYRQDIKFFDQQLKDLGSSDPILSGQLRSAIAEWTKQIAILEAGSGRVKEVIKQGVEEQIRSKTSEQLSSLLTDFSDTLGSVNAAISGDLTTFGETVKQRFKELFPLGTVNGVVDEAADGLVQAVEVVKRIASATSNLSQARNQIAQAEALVAAVAAGPDAYRAYLSKQAIAEPFGGTEALSTLERLVKELGADTALGSASLKDALANAGLSASEVSLLNQIFEVVAKGSGTLGEALTKLKDTFAKAADAAKQLQLAQGLVSQNQNNQISQFQLQAALGQISPEEAQVRQQEVQAGLVPGSSNPAVRQQLLESVRFGAALEQQRGIVEQLRNGFQGLFGDVINGFDQAAQAGTSFWDALRQAAGNFFNSLSRALLDIAAQQTASGILGFLGKLIPGLNPGGGGLGGFDLLGGVGNAFSGGAATAALSAASDASFGITNLPALIPGLGFANGGIARGGFRAFASGGIITQPTLGLVGEGRYNEAVIPLPDGRSVPVQLSGGGAGGGVQIGSVNISVQNTGETLSVEAQRQIANQARAIAVEEIVRQTRSGGVLRQGAYR